MTKLVKINDGMFKEMYSGERGSKKVICILDENCVRYMVFENGKKKRTSEFNNAQKAKCFANAEKALNN